MPEAWHVRINPTTKAGNAFLFVVFISFKVDCTLRKDENKVRETIKKVQNHIRTLLAEISLEYSLLCFDRNVSKSAMKQNYVSRRV